MAALIPRPNYPPYSARSADEGREEVDGILSRMEHKVHKEYTQAAREMKKKADDYLAFFVEEDAKRVEMLKAGKITADEYKQWRISHIATGRRWYEQAAVLASDMTNANQIVASIINGYMPDVFAVGYNYSLYQGEIAGGFETSFTLYDRDTVIRLMQEEPELLPVEAKINVPEDMLWNTKQLTSAMTQAIVQGEAIEDIAERLVSSVAGMNERVAIRNARTATTSAENGGRYNGYRRLKSAGVDLTVEWQATLDGRTRHTHRLLDGQRRDVDKPFEVDGQKIMYAGDPYAPQGLIWNCRCTMLCWVKGFEENLMLKAQTHPDGMTYAEWKFAKQEEYERQQAQPKKSRVNPDNPSYGTPTEEEKEAAKIAAQKPAAEQKPAYHFDYDVAGKDAVNKHLAAMHGIEREQWEKNLRSADIHIVDSSTRQSEEFINDMVFLFDTSSDDTVFHEVSHAIDKTCVKVETELSGKSLRFGEWRDYEPYKTESGGARWAARHIYDIKSEEGDGASQYVKDMSALFDWAGVPHANGKTDMSDLDVELLLDDKLLEFQKLFGGDASSTLSDMIDAITLGRYGNLVAIHGGHGSEYWMRDASRRWGEAWAELSALHAQQNTAAIAEIRKILPETTDAVEIVWSVVYERKPFEYARVEETERRVSKEILRISPGDV